MATSRARYISDLLLVHAEELAFLWGQRRDALVSRQHTLREYNELNDRIEAHVQGLLVADAPTLRALLQPALASPDRDEVFAAAYPLLRCAEAATTHAVVVAFSRAAGPALAGLRDALSLAPPALYADELRSALEHAKPANAAAAAAALANLRLLDAASPRLAELLQDADASVCELAWRVVALADAAATGPVPVRPFAAALKHPAPVVRHAGWNAAAWANQVQALPALRHVATGADPAALHWLAVLGDENDLELLQQAALRLEDPSVGCALLSRHGHPSHLALLVGWMHDTKPALAVAAGEAYTRITGVEVRGQRTQLAVDDDADEFTREMAPDVWLPDVAKARSVLQRRAEEWSQGVRWCRGLRLDGEVSRETLVQLDLEARWEVAARAAFAGRRLSTPAPIH